MYDCDANRKSLDKIDVAAIESIGVFSVCCFTVLRQDKERKKATNITIVNRCVVGKREMRESTKRFWFIVYSTQQKHQRQQRRQRRTEKLMNRSRIEFIVVSWLAFQKERHFERTSHKMEICQMARDESCAEITKTKKTEKKPFKICWKWEIVECGN